MHSNFPPQFLREFAYIQTDPVQTRNAMVAFYLGKERELMWNYVTTEHGVVMRKWTGKLLHENHDLALRLV